MDELKRLPQLGNLKAGSLTVKDYLELWRKEQSRQWKPRTRELYQRYIKDEINPVLGRKRLAQLKPLDIQQLIGAIGDGGRVRTANLVRTVLYSALKQAVRWQLIPHNPVEAVDRLRETPKEATLWTPEQVRTFLNTAKDHRLYAAFYLMIVTGLRRGEVLGLRWNDLEDDSLRVIQTITVVENKVAFGTPKTERGARRVTLPPDAVEVLAQHRAAQDTEHAKIPEAWEHPELVFTTEIGTPLHPRNFYRTWQGLIKEAELPRIRLHDLRHLHVSLLIQRGFDPKTIADRVGHADPGFTLRRYGHLFEARRRAAAVPMDELLAEDQEGQGDEKPP